MKRIICLNCIVTFQVFVSEQKKLIANPLAQYNISTIMILIDETKILSV